METTATLKSCDCELEGLYAQADKNRGVLVTHPHPLYGGDMHNPVVEILAEAYQRQGFSTLRFNFRGVGRSSGQYAEGIGEIDDVRAGCRFLMDAGLTEIHLAGYSFGAWVNARSSVCDKTVKRMLMVSPPVALLDFSETNALDCLDLVVVGDRDEMAPLNTVKKMVPVWNPQARLEVITGADHFFSGCLRQLAGRLSLV